MTSQTQFIRDVHDALVHLYDLPYLSSHRLVEAVVVRRHAEAPGRALRRLLLDVIQDLKPPAESPHDSVAAARYQFLHLRYVQGKSIEEMAKQLNLSERQLYRRQRDALEAVATTLVRQLHLPSDNIGIAPGQFTPPRSDSSDGASLESDVDRIGMAHTSPPVNLLEVLAGIEGTIVPFCQTAGCEIRVQTEHAVLLVTVDRVALRQALLALLMFAIDTAHSGTILIDVGKVEDQARISVTMPTVTKGNLPSIDDSNLAVCRRLIDLQGGQVHLEHDNLLKAVIVLPSFQQRTVLVVDDNADSRHLFTRCLEARGYHVLTADSGEQALRVALCERPDAILLDVMLPSSDGYEVLQALASDSNFGWIPVIVCTVLKQRDLALALGATEFVAKPFTQGEILDALDRCWECLDSRRLCWREGDA